MKNKLNEQVNYPDFSIIIPTRNRAELLKKTLRRIERIEYKGVWEVIIVNNNSSDNTEKVVREFLQKNRNFRMIIEKREGISFARNAGIEKSKYNHIVFIDDDVFVNKDILMQLAHSLEKFPYATAIGGKIVAVSEKQNLQTFQKVGKYIPWIFTHIVRNDRVCILHFPDFLVSAFLCFRKDKLGKERFDERLGKLHWSFYIGAEDFEIGIRLLAKGNMLVYDSSLRVYHYFDRSRLSVLYLVKRFIQTGIENKFVENILKEQYVDWDGCMYQRNERKTCIQFLLQGKDFIARVVQFYQLLFFYIGYFGWRFFIRKSK